MNLIFFKGRSIFFPAKSIFPQTFSCKLQDKIENIGRHDRVLLPLGHNSLVKGQLRYEAVWYEELTEKY